MIEEFESRLGLRKQNYLDYKLEIAGKCHLHTHTEVEES